MRTRISMGNKDMVVYRFCKVLEYLFTSQLMKQSVVYLCEEVYCTSTVKSVEFMVAQFRGI